MGFVVLGVWPGDDVGAVVRARESVLAEVELERLNLQQKCWKKREEGRRGEGGGGAEKQNDEGHKVG